MDSQHILPLIVSSDQRHSYSPHQFQKGSYSQEVYDVILLARLCRSVP
ncbi:unnamed protein product [Rhodiola kirilowii]